MNGQKIVTKQSKSKKNFPMSDTFANIFATDPYFATYIELLPKQGAQPREPKDRLRRMKFLQCEDNLLALGLNQFKGHARYELINEHLLPIKEPKQLQIRVKNACTLQIQYNPVAVVKKDKYLPELQNTMEIKIPRGRSSFLCFPKT